ncbi:response regulator, partial [Ureibacillus thermosphaericus]|uniref:response regulator n=1 Tax=Ureibacillus thermosphaericus TaxID=51173 RepID=UPI0030C99C5C
KEYPSFSCYLLINYRAFAWWPPHLLSVLTFPQQMRGLNFAHNNFTHTVVDDVDFMRNPIIEIVKNLGVSNVKGLTNGKELVEFFITCVEEKKRINLIILDVVMPVMSGIEALRQIRKMDSDVPVVLFTGYNEKAVKEALTLGVKDFLNKPIIEEQVKKVLRKYL